jgi:hypothetical protein
MRFKVVFSYLLFALVTYSQRVELKTIDPIICFNDNNGELAVIDDTNWIQTYSVQGKLISRTRIIEKAVSITELKEEFIPVFMHKKLHFVERGCGRVLRFHQGFLERIDHSFPHRNQYDALVVTYHDTLYCVGGYGFYTVKDHVTYFDEALGQWFLRNNSFKIQHQILKPLYVKTRNSICVFGGLKVREMLNEKESNEINGKVLEFNFKSKSWRDVGKLNEYLLDYMHGRIFTNGQILIARNDILLFKFGKNKVHIIPYDKTTQHLYKFQGKMVVNRLVRTTNNIYVNFIDFQNEVEFLNANSNKVIPIFSNQTRDKKENHDYIIGFVVLLLVLLLPSFVLYRLKRKKATSEIPIEVHDLLEVWKSRPDFSIELSDINELVAYDNPELETLKKRREGLLKRLKQYMIEQHKFEEDEVFYTALSPRDKRIKLFILHPKVVKWYNKVK